MNLDKKIDIGRRSVGTPSDTAEHPWSKCAVPGEDGDHLAAPTNQAPSQI